MLLKPRQLGTESLPEDILITDRKECREFGPCGVGSRALYLNNVLADRIYYVPIGSVQRVFKRIAMSKGGFTGKGAFSTLSYLVVEYDNGREKQCLFKYEEDVDRILDYLKSRYPQLPVHSREAEQRLAQRKKRLAEESAMRDVPDNVKQHIAGLQQAERYLLARPELYADMSQAARQKRISDISNPSGKWAALLIILMGAAASAYGIYALLTHAGVGIYFLAFGLAAIFIFAGANVFPTSRNNRRHIEDSLAEAVAAMDEYIKACPGFPVPAYYAHPVVLKRMREILYKERADTVSGALQVLKDDLKSLNSDVTVEQDEYDEIMAIKPLFLVMDYR